MLTGTLEGFARRATRSDDWSHCARRTAHDDQSPPTLEPTIFLGQGSWPLDFAGAQEPRSPTFKLTSAATGVATSRDARRDLRLTR